MHNLKKSLPFILIVSVLISVSCQRGLDEAELTQFLDEKEAVYEDISVELGTAYWNMYADKPEVDLESPKYRYLELFSDEDLNSIIEEWYKKRDKIKDETLRRRVEVWQRILLAAKVDYDEEMLKLQSQLEGWLSQATGAEDRPSQEEMDSMTLKFMKLRNEKAINLGFPNYAEMVLEISELGSDWFHNYVETIFSKTKTPYEEMVNKIIEDKEKKELGLMDVQRMVMQFYINQGSPQMEREKMLQLTRETVENIGIAYDALPLVFEEKQLPRGMGGQGLAIQIPSDFRIVLLPKHRFSGRMHEIGHGLHGMFTRIESPILKGYEWCLGSDCPAYSEGMAETMARFIRNAEWLNKHFGLGAEEIAKRKTAQKSYLPAYLRYHLVNMMLEVELYKDLTQDPKELQDRLREKYLLVGKAEGRYQNLANAIFVSYPVYLQNYSIADIISWQIHSTLEEKFGKDFPFNSEVGEFLKENIWRNGALYHWQERIKRATGRELDILGYLKAFGL